MGRVRARELEREMMVLSRSKNAASMVCPMVGQRRCLAEVVLRGLSKASLPLTGVPEEVCRPGRKSRLARGGGGIMTPEAQTDSSSPPAPFPRLLHTPPEEPLPFFGHGPHFTGRA